MTSMPELAAEWQNFDQLTADKLYVLLRFRHDLCISKRFLELGCTIPGPYLDADGRRLRQSLWLVAEEKLALPSGSIWVTR